MNTNETIDGLRSLSLSLKRLRTHLEWLSLKQSEWRPGDPPVLAAEKDLVQDLRREEAVFLKTATEIHEAINEAEEEGVGGPTLTKRRRQLLGLEAEFHRLDIPKGL